MKKCLTLALAVALMLALATGCTSTPAPSATSAAPAATSAAAPAATSAASAAPAPADPQPARELTIAAVRFSQHVDWDQMYIWQQFERDTNIKVNWEYINASGSALTEKRNLMVSTGELYDAFYGCRWLPAEVARYGDEGIFVPIQDYLEEYAPNTTKLYTEYPMIKVAMIMPTGDIYGFPTMISGGRLRVGTSMYLRTEWMTNLNLEWPKTPEDVYNILVAFKTQDPNGNGQADELVYTDYEDQPAYAGLRNTLMGAWGLGNRGSANAGQFDIDPDTNELRFWPTDPRHREVLGLIHRMYVAGAIDPDAITQDEMTWGVKASQEDPAIIGCVTNDVLRAYNAEKPYEGTGVLEGPYGDKMWASVIQPVSRNANFVITKECQDIPLALEFADYWMDDGPHSEMFFWGEEGVHFTREGDMRVRTEAVTNDPQGRSLDQMISTFSSQPGGSYFGISPYNPPNMSYNDTIADEKVRPYLPEIVWPQFTLTLDELKVTSGIGVDTTTYFEESVTAFVTGEMDIDKDWDTFVKTFDQIGLDQLKAVYQSAYDRYKANGGK